MSKQLNCAIVGDAKYEVKQLPDQWVKSCEHSCDALHLCIANSVVPRSYDTWANLLGMSKGQFCAILNSKSSDRKRNLEIDLIAGLETLAGNTAITQYLKLRREGKLFCQQTQDRKIAELEAQIAELRAQKAG